MKCVIRSMLASMAVVAFASSAWGQDKIFFSFSATDPTAITQPAWHEITGSAANRTLYVWVATPTSGSDDLTPPDRGLTPISIAGSLIDVPNSSASIDLKYTDTGAISGFTAAQDFNGAFSYSGSGTNPVSGTDVNGLVRANVWDSASNYTIAGNPSNVSATAITGVNAAVSTTTLNNTQADTTSNGGNPTGVARGLAITQSAANVSGGPTKVAVAGNTDFLLAQVQFTTTAYGSDTIGIASDGLGLFRGTTNLTGSYTYGNINITVTSVPEPVSLGLVLFGGFALLGGRKEIR